MTPMERFEHGRAIFMPDGTPAPEVMTIEQAGQFLRLDEGPGRNERDGAKSVDRLVQQKQLRPLRLGRDRKFALSELLRLIHDRTDKATA